MATCVTLTKGRKLPCKGGNGGFKAVGFQVYDSLNLVSATTGSVSTIPSGSIYRYELKNTGNTYNEEIAADAESRTVVYNGTLNLVLHKLDLDTRNEVKMLAMGEVVPFIETYNGDILCIGSQNGAELTGGGMETGGAKTDFQGFRMTFTTSENEPYYTLNSAAKIAYASQSVNGL